MQKKKEVDMMYELMNAKKESVKDGKKNITFDYEGKIIEIKKPNDEKLPSVLENPKIKFKSAVS